MKTLGALLLSLACAAPTLSLAQAYWEWVDKSGRKVFSDRAPPPDVPPVKIIKQPGGQPLADSSPVPTAEPATPAASAPPRTAGSAPGGADFKQLEEKKKQAEAQEAEKRRVQAEAIAKVRAENCVRAKSAKANFDSGARISIINERGERAIIDDAARAAEVKRIQRIIDSECQPLDPAALPQ